MINDPGCPSRRLAKVTMSLEVLHMMLAEGMHHYRAQGLPEDAKPLRLGIDHLGRAVLLLEHDGFPLTFEGCEVIELGVSFVRIDDDPTPDALVE